MMVNATTVAYKKLAERVNINEIVAGTNITRYLDMVTMYKELAIIEYNGLVLAAYKEYMMSPSYEDFVSSINNQKYQEFVKSVNYAVNKAMSAIPPMPPMPAMPAMPKLNMKVMLIALFVVVLFFVLLPNNMPAKTVDEDYDEQEEESEPTEEEESGPTEEEESGADAPTEEEESGADAPTEYEARMKLVEERERLVSINMKLIKKLNKGIQKRSRSLDYQYKVLARKTKNFAKKVRKNKAARMKMAAREMPIRQTTRIVKGGFYNEQELQRNVWNEMKKNEQVRVMPVRENKQCIRGFYNER